MYEKNVKYSFYIEQDILAKIKIFFQLRPLTGMAVVSQIMESEPTSLDLYGFDFYK